MFHSCDLDDTLDTILCSRSELDFITFSPVACFISYLGLFGLRDGVCLHFSIVQYEVYIDYTTIDEWVGPLLNGSAIPH